MSLQTKEVVNSTNATIYTYGTYPRIGYIYATHEDYVELMPTWGYAASAFILFIIGFFGFFLNLMVILLMFKDKQLWTPLNLILFNLVCSDFSVSILGNPFTLISALAHRWIFGKTMCVMYGFFMTLLGITSITTLTVLSFERYLMVSRPLSSRHLSMRGASLSVFFIWCYSLAVTSPPLFGWGNFVNEAANISCSINWEEQTLNTLTYILFLFAMGLILPVSIITFSYLNIIKTLKKNAMRMGRVSKTESRVTIMVLIMIITFLVAWTPYSIFALVEQFAPYDVVSPGLAVIPALVAKSSICYDPIIYVGMNSQFRTSLKKIFGFGNKDDLVQERAVENTLMSPTRAVSQNNDNNIKLQYLNPKNNTLVAVTIYQEGENESNSGDDKNCCENRRKKNKLEKMKKKIILTNNSGSEKSAEISTEYCHTDQIRNKNCGKPKASIINVHKDGTVNKKYVTYNLQEASDYHGVSTVETKEEKQNTYKDYKIVPKDQFEKSPDHSSSGNNNEVYNSDDMLLNREIYKKNKSDSGVRTADLIGWDETNIQNDAGKDNLFLLQNPSFSFDETPLPVRRKSLANTHFNTESIDFTRAINSPRRKSSSNVLSGHTRKFSTALRGSKGSNLTRLKVDEREQAKFMCFDDADDIFEGNRQWKEQML